VAGAVGTLGAAFERSTVAVVDDRDAGTAQVPGDRGRRPCVEPGPGDRLTDLAGRDEAALEAPLDQLEDLSGRG
jgi:hypothetical protein